MHNHLKTYTIALSGECNFHYSECTGKRLLAGLRPDPLGELTVPFQTPKLDQGEPRDRKGIYREGIERMEERESINQSSFISGMT